MKHIGGRLWETLVYRSWENRCRLYWFYWIRQIMFLRSENDQSFDQLIWSTCVDFDRRIVLELPNFFKIISKRIYIIETTWIFLVCEPTTMRYLDIKTGEDRLTTIPRFLNKTIRLLDCLQHFVNSPLWKYQMKLPIVYHMLGTIDTNALWEVFLAEFKLAKLY